MYVLRVQKKTRLHRKKQVNKSLETGNKETNAEILNSVVASRFPSIAIMKIGNGFWTAVPLICTRASHYSGLYFQLVDYCKPSNPEQFRKVEGQKTPTVNYTSYKIKYVYSM